MTSRTALVTGASRGIGRATAVRLADEGMNIAVNYHESATAAAETVEEVEKRGVDATAIQADVGDRDQVREMVQTVRESLGDVDYLVNNAGTIERPGHWQELTQEDWDRTVEVDMEGVYNCIRVVGPNMLDRESGKIVNVTSTYGWMGAAPVIGYSASKAGVTNMTKGFAKELAPHVNVNGVAFGHIDTDMTREAGEELIDIVVEETPLNRLGTPEEAAETIEFLLSDRADFITGEVVTVDGGHIL